MLERRGITQKQFAEDLQVSQATVYKWLHGSMPLGGALTRLSEYFELSGDYLLYPAKYSQPLWEYAADMDAAVVQEDRVRAEQSLRTKTAMQSEREDLREQRDQALAKIERLKRLLKEALAEL